MYRALLTNQSDTSFTFSPISASSSLSLLFLGARSSTSWQINELLKLDEMISFNPHLLYKNITNSLLSDTKAATCASTKHVLVSQSSDPLLSFYKMRASFFYGAEVDTVDFSDISTEVTSRVNSVASTQTSGRVGTLVTEADTESLSLAPPLAVVTGNYFQGQFAQRPAVSSLNYIAFPRARRLVPVPALAWSGSFNAGYEPDLDCTAVEIPYSGGEVSLVLLLPGKVTEFLASGLEQLEQRINSERWEAVLGSFMSRSLDLSVPSFSLHSVLDLEPALMDLGLEDAFSLKADFSGLNGARDLKLASFLQVNTFRNELDQVRRRRQGRGEQGKDPVLEMLSRRNRKNRQDVTYQIHFERQFMYVVRHNPTGLVLHLGRHHHPHHHHHHS